MFAFPEPPSAQTVANPCPCCGGHQAVPFYATSLRQFYRCVRCTAMFAVALADGHA
jgi:hypothetical protein